MTIPDIITIAQISQYLAACDIQKGGRDGIYLSLPQKLYCIRKNVQWLYNLDNTNTTLIPTANYLYSLCAPYSLEAGKISGSGGGSVSPIAPIINPIPFPLDFIVDFDTTPIVVGGNGLLLDGTNGNYDYRGFNLSFDRNGQPQYTTNPTDGSTYFSWNRITGQFLLLNGNAQESERFRLTPIG